MKNIMFIAPPAAGKGTQAELVAKKYNIPHISTGNILRDISKEDSELGIYVRETLQAGKLVKNEISYEIIEKRISKDDCKKGFIIDGFPRRMQQAIKYEESLQKLGYDIGLVFYIEVDEKTLKKRVTGRRICEDCGETYSINEDGKASVTTSTCDKCGARLYQRSDDNLESFRTRYKMYLEETEPLVKYYKDRKLLYKINGIDTIKNVFTKIDKVISEADIK